MSGKGQHSPAPRLAEGFTLVEVLIAISLSSLVMLGMLGAMRTIGDASSRQELRSEQLDEIRMGSRFLREVLSSARIPGPSSGPAQPEGGLSFAGSGQQITWLGVVPARHGAGGLSWLRISLQRTDVGEIFALRILPFDPQTEPRWEEAEAHWLADQVQHLAFQFQAHDQGAWQGHWDTPASLPARVRIDLRTATAGDWPLLVVPLTAASHRP